MNAWNEVFGPIHADPNSGLKKEEIDKLAWEIGS